MTVAKCSQDMHHGLNDDGLTVKSAQQNRRRDASAAADRGCDLIIIIMKYVAGSCSRSRRELTD